MEKLLWECIYKDTNDNQVYAERFEATNAVNALFQLSQHLEDKCDFIPLGVKPILYSSIIQSGKYSDWINDARKFHRDIKKTIKIYESELNGVIE